MFSEGPSEGGLNWKLLSIILPLLAGAICCFAWIVAWRVEDPTIKIIWQTPQPTARPNSTSTPPPSPTVAPLRSAPTRMPTLAQPTPTNTRVVITVRVNHTATARAIEQATAQANLKAEVMTHLQTLAHPRPPVSAWSDPVTSHSRESRLVLAHYFAWFNDNGWDDCNISAGDKPLEPYHSDDPTTIARHIRMARDIGLNGFTLHWFAPDDRTDRNFGTLLTRSEGFNFSSTIVFSRHIWHGSPAPSQQNIAEALHYVRGRYSTHPNFLRLENKPVIFFTNVYRTPTTSGHPPQQFWAAVREQVDPQRQMWWIAEGLDASYLNVFDGLYVFKISHAAYPHDYVKSPRWGAQVRAWEAKTGQPKLWIATISPGWDDLRAGCKPDVRAPNTAHRLDRANGSVYEASFAAALDSNPDWLLVGSFNEWVEGTYIEPSLLYGDIYMQMTGEFVRRFQGR